MTHAWTPCMLQFSCEIQLRGSRMMQSRWLSGGAVAATMCRVQNRRDPLTEDFVLSAHMAAAEQGVSDIDRRDVADINCAILLLFSC